MKIKKRITVVADILVDEDFNTDFLCICEMYETGYGNPELFVGRSDNFEVLDYISQETVELDEHDSTCSHNPEIIKDGQLGECTCRGNKSNENS